MKRINLLELNEASAPKIPTDRIVEVSAAFFLAYVLVTSSGYAIRNHFQNSELHRLELESSELSSKIGPLQLQVELVEKNKQLFTSLQSIFDRKTGWSQAFREFSRLLPKGVWFTGLSSLRADGDLKFLLRGESLSQIKMAEFLGKLGHSPTFERAAVVYSEKEPTVRPEVFRFELSIPLQGALAGGGTP